jgi:hypothetical protein
MRARTSRAADRNYYDLAAMGLLSRRTQGSELAFEAYGVEVAVATEDAELIQRIESRLPPGHRRVAPSVDMPHLSLMRDRGEGFDVVAGGTAVTMSAELEVALRVLDSQIRAEIALRSPEAVFVHAGAVGHDGRAILLPGRSFSGKTTLVAALVRAGASYYSDEFAVLDEDGLLHAYPKPLSMRAEGARWGEESHAADLGGETGDVPLPVGMIVSTSYRSGESFEPERRSAGQGAIALVGNAVPARHRSDKVMATARRAAADALVLAGNRGEAEAAAQEILAWSERLAGAR